jgi:hypothetical protein
MKASGLLGKLPRPDCRRGRKRADTGMVRQVSHSTGPPAPSHASAPSFPRTGIPHCIVSQSSTFLLTHEVFGMMFGSHPQIQYVMPGLSYGVVCSWRPFSVTHTVLLVASHCIPCWSCSSPACFGYLLYVQSLPQATGHPLTHIAQCASGLAFTSMTATVRLSHPFLLSSIPSIIRTGIKYPRTILNLWRSV